MKRRSPSNLDRKLVRRLLQEITPVNRTDLRVDRLSAALIGRPYQSSPLVGSAQSPEQFTAETDSFDCVTFIETVLALAQTIHADEFPKTLCDIRYAGSEIAWHRRNHYMTQWIRENVRSGYIRRVAEFRPAITKNRILNIVPGLAPRRMTFSCVPKYTLLRSATKIKSGDLLFFASTRHNLDVFHCGIAIHNGHGLQLRHASRSRGGVVEQALAEFLRENRMSGVIVVRPI